MKIIFTKQFFINLMDKLLKSLKQFFLYFRIKNYISYNPSDTIIGRNCKYHMSWYRYK